MFFQPCAIDDSKYSRFSSTNKQRLTFHGSLKMQITSTSSFLVFPRLIQKITRWYFKSRAKVLQTVFITSRPSSEILGTRGSSPQFPFEWQSPFSVTKPQEEKRFVINRWWEKENASWITKWLRVCRNGLVAIFFLSHSGDSHSK